MVTIVRSFIRIALFVAPLFLSVPAWANRTVTDQLGKQVSIPDDVNRAVILQHQTLNIAVQLNAMDKVVGILDEWKQQLGANYPKLAHRSQRCQCQAA